MLPRVLRTVVSCPGSPQRLRRTGVTTTILDHIHSKTSPIITIDPTSASEPRFTVSRPIDPRQAEQLDEPCIVVDEQDKVIRAETKKNCHLFTQDNRGILHRAFSVFLFNTKGELLLQQRSGEKVTFAGHFTNTCCSHPLFVNDELEEDEAIGVKRAAQRRLQTELGIPEYQLPIDSFTYLTRIQYCAASDPPWGENEIDYILFVKRDVDLEPNTNEVRSYCYVHRKQLSELLGNFGRKGIPVTPWFCLINDRFLDKWWDNLDNLKSFQDHRTIHRMT